jgi:WD40 repeat protein
VTLRRPSDRPESYAIQVFDAGTGKPVRKFPDVNMKPARNVAELKLPSQIAYAPDGRRLATGAWDGTIVVWDAVTGKRLHEFAGHRGRVVSLAFSLDGKRLGSGGSDTTVLIWAID